MRWSVVIPAYNAQSTIARAIASAQSAGADEVVVVDDGSNDATAAIARASEARVHSQANSGAYEARITGFRSASGNYVTLLDADDELLPDARSTFEKAISSFPDAVVIAGQVHLGSGMRRGGLLPLQNPTPSISWLVELGFSPWPPCAAIFLRSALIAQTSLDPAPLSERFADDYELLLRLSLLGPVHQVAVPVAIYTVSGGKSTGRGYDDLIAATRIRQYYATWVKIKPTPHGMRWIKSNSLLRRAASMRASGRQTVAALLILRALVISPALVADRVARKVQGA